jgi:hypothetical protein
LCRPCYRGPLLPCGRGEMVDARDLKSLGGKPLCRFESGRPHHIKIKHLILLQYL